MQRTDTEVSFVIEQDEAAYLANDTKRRAYFSACITLTLGVLGSSILPIPFAISKTGVLVGCLTMLVVAWANDATSCMLIRAAGATGKPTYEALAEWAGGRPWKVFTQLALILLLWGTMCGGLALISDVGVILIDRLAAAEAGWALPGWVGGRTCMTAVALLVLFPLCLQRHMRQLETAATAGVVLVIGLIGLLAYNAFRSDFPAIQDGSLPLWSLKVDGHLPEAFSVVGYAFYMQPMMMPLLQEMPEGRMGIQVMQQAVHTTLFGVALTVYFSMGLFGAAMYGQETEGNVMLNNLISTTAGTAVLYSSMLVYLALGMTTTQYALRQSLDTILVGEGAGFTWRRHVLLTTFTVGTSLTVALLVPDKAEKIYAVVGATAVCVVCYVIPVFIQLQLYRRRRRSSKQQHAYCEDQEAQLSAGLLAHEAPAGDGQVVAPTLAAQVPGSRGSSVLALYNSAAWEALHEVVLPVVILLLGVGFSVAALWVAVSAFVVPSS